MSDYKILKILENDKKEIKEKLDSVQKHIDYIVDHRKFSIIQIRSAGKKIRDDLLPPYKIAEKIVEYLMKEEPVRIPKSMSHIKIAAYSAYDIIKAAEKVDDEFPRTISHFVEEIISILYRGK